jgi:hypothetical protein
MVCHAPSYSIYPIMEISCQYSQLHHIQVGLTCSGIQRPNTDIFSIETGKSTGAQHNIIVTSQCSTVGYAGE